ncbi:MAG: hypothetical protein LC136_09220 [Burkholderiales bacterium]|nr:hypothetical protein [Burkholderiales bacterium]
MSFFSSPQCASRKLCGACRDRLNLSVRLPVARLERCDVDFPCPHGVPWTTPTAPPPAKRVTPERTERTARDSDIKLLAQRIAANRAACAGCEHLRAGPSCELLRRGCGCAATHAYAELMRTEDWPKGCRRKGAPPPVV